MSYRFSRAFYLSCTSKRRSRNSNQINGLVHFLICVTSWLRDMLSAMTCHRDMKKINRQTQVSSPVKHSFYHACELKLIIILLLDDFFQHFHVVNDGFRTIRFCHVWIIIRPKDRITHLHTYGAIDVATPHRSSLHSFFHFLGRVLNLLAVAGSLDFSLHLTSQCALMSFVERIYLCSLVMCESRLAW